MPISDEFAMKLLESQDELIKQLRSENAALLEIILRQQRILPEVDITTLHEPGTKAIGKKPWYMLQKDLERSYSKPKLSDISGITESELA